MIKDVRTARVSASGSHSRFPSPPPNPAPRSLAVKPFCDTSFKGLGAQGQGMVTTYLPRLITKCSQGEKPKGNGANSLWEANEDERNGGVSVCPWKWGQPGVQVAFSPGLLGQEFDGTWDFYAKTGKLGTLNRPAVLFWFFPTTYMNWSTLLTNHPSTNTPKPEEIKWPFSTKA